MSNPGQMSEKFKEQEKQNVVDKANKEGEEAVDRTIVFWAPSPGYKIGNFVKEEFSGGRLIQSEASLVFLNHICVGDPDTKKGKKIIDYVRNSDAFEAGTIKECKGGMAEAATRTMEWKTNLRIKEQVAEAITSTQHVLTDG